jgi:hypothetical protein
MKHASPIALDSEMIAPRPGQIKGAFYRGYNTSKNAWQGIAFARSDVFFLQSGQTLSVKAGKAYVVKTGKNTWLLANFHEDGQMTGPLIYAEVKAERPTESLKKSEAFNRKIHEMADALVGGILALAFSSLVLFWVSESSYFGSVIAHIVFALIVIVTAISCRQPLKLLPSYVKYLCFSRRGDQAALRMLQKIEGTKPQNVPLSEFDTNFLKQNISNE